MTLRGSRLAALVAATPILATAVPARAADERQHRRPVPSLLWFGTQLLPSPEWTDGSDGVAFGLRWQVTPVLYSFGANRRVSRWRTFVVEPLVRHSGSVELYFSPEVLLDANPRFVARPGARVYFPIVEHGEALSMSVGASYQRIAGVDAVAAEAGVYFLFGILGVQVTHAPGQSTPAKTTVALSVRYF